MAQEAPASTVVPPPPAPREASASTIVRPPPAPQLTRTTSVPPRPHPKQPRFAGGSALPPLYRKTGPESHSKHGVPLVEELGVDGFYRNHLPDKNCSGGPKIWNDLATYWETGSTGSGAGGEKTMKKAIWWGRYDPTAVVPVEKVIQKWETFLKVRGVRDSYGLGRKMKDPKRWIPGFQGHLLRYPFMTEDGTEVPTATLMTHRLRGCGTAPR